MSKHIPCNCELEYMKGTEFPEGYACACIGPPMVKAWNGQTGYLAFVPSLQSEVDDKTKRLIELCLTRPDEITILDWISHIKELAREIQKEKQNV